MDQYPFEVNFYINGLDMQNFIDLLKREGYSEQANVTELQFEKQLKEM